MATWATHSTPNTGAESIFDIISLGSGKWVAVGSTGTVLTSANDGTSWTARTAAENNTWFSLAYDGTTVVAVSLDGANRVMTSTDDGHTWTAHAAAAANQWTSVTYASFIGSGMFIAVSLDGADRVMTSVNSGASWTSQSDAGSFTWSGVVASDALVIAYGLGADNQVMTSTNGTAWTLGTPTADIFVGSGNNGRTVVYSAATGNFAIAGTSFPGSITYPVNTAMFATTPDGATWTYSAGAVLPDYFSLFGLVAADELDGYIGSLPFLFDFTATPTIIGFTDDQAATWTDEDTTFSSSTWSCGAWDGDSGTVIFWDVDKTNTMLVGVFDVSSLTAVSPDTGTRLGGTVVTLTGTGLTGVVTGDVLFDASAALSVAVASDGLSLTCITPAHTAGPVDVTITDVGSLASAYTYVAVDRIVPNRGTFEGGTAVTIRGFGFDYATGVTFDGVSLTSIVYVSNETITGVTPAHASGAVDVTVIGVGTLTAGYTYDIPLAKAPPQPYYSGLQQENNSPRIEAGWSRWLDTIAARAYNPVLGPASKIPAENVIGVLDPDNIPDLPFTKIQLDNSPRLLGRTTSGAGDAEEIQVSGGLTLFNGYLSISGLLPTGYVIGDILYADTDHSLARLADVSVGSYLRSGGVATAPLWSTLKLPNAATVGAVVFATSTNTYGENATNFLWDNTTNVLEMASGNGTTVAAGNLGIGVSALAALVAGGTLNTAYGYEALKVVTTSGANTAIGYRALVANTGERNTAIGSQAMRSNTTGTQNVAIGGGPIPPMRDNVDGSNNMAIGSQALAANVSGGSNVAIGSSALVNAAASYNTAIGDLAGSVVSSGARNVFIGQRAGMSISTGSNNTVLGAGDIAVALGITTGSGNTVIGANITGLASGLTDNIILATGTAGAIKAQFDGSNWALNSASFPATGTAGLVFPDGTALASMASNTAAIYANDVAGTVKMFAIDEAGAGGEILTTVSTIPYTSIGSVPTATVLGRNSLGTGAAEALGTLPSAVQLNITSVGALNAGSITSGFGAIDIGADAFTGGNANLSGILTVTGIGTHTFNSSGAASNVVQVTNSTAGTANFSRISLGNDLGQRGFITLLSSTFTSSGFNTADGLTIASTGTGGITLVSSNATGAVSVYAANTIVGKFSIGRNWLFGTATDPGTGSVGIVFSDGDAFATMASNTAGLYANDVGGTVRVFGIDEAGVTGALTMQSATLTSGRVPFSTTGGILTDDSDLTFATDTLTATKVSAPTSVSTGTLAQTGKTTTYNNIATAGWGVPAIYAEARSVAQVAAVASVATYTVGGSDGSFLVSANVLVTTSTTHNFTVEVAYTDEGNTARTLTLTFSQISGVFVTAITNVTGAGPYEGVPLHIRCKASTAITVRTQAAGVYTTVTYNVEGLIQQVA